MVSCAPPTPKSSQHSGRKQRGTPLQAEEDKIASCEEVKTKEICSNSHSKKIKAEERKQEEKQEEEKQEAAEGKAERAEGTQEAGERKAKKAEEKQKAQETAR